VNITYFGFVKQILKLKALSRRMRNQPSPPMAVGVWNDDYLLDFLLKWGIIGIISKGALSSTCGFPSEG